MKYFIDKYKNEFVCEKQEFPSKDFAELTGISDLYTEWILPFNLTSDELWNVWYHAREKENHRMYNQLYKQLYKLNPPLKQLSDEYGDNYIMAGAISKYNYDDILYFKTVDRDEKDRLFDQQVRIFNMVKADPYRGWLASKSTLLKILNVIDVALIRIQDESNSF